MEKDGWSDGEDFEIIRIREAHTDAKIVDEYDVGPCHVTITTDGLYNVRQPAITDEGRDVAMQIIGDALDVLAGRNSESKAAKAVDMVDHAMRLKLYRKVWQKERDAILYYAKMKLGGYMEVDTLMQDPDIEDIFCTGYGKEVCVKHRRHADLKILHTNITFGTDARVAQWVQTMAARYGKPMMADNHMAHRTTPENHKLMLIEDANYSSFVVRKYVGRSHTITKLLENGTLSVDMAAYLWFLMDARPFILVTGETGSGKTTMLNALMDMTNPRKSAMVIEETREIRLVNPHVQYYLPDEMHGIHSIRFLMNKPIRAFPSPHYVVIGEVSGEETRAVFYNASAGHNTVTTFHAYGVTEALDRLVREPLNVGEKSLASLWCILHVSQVTDKDGKTSRRVIDCAEIDASDDYPRMRHIFGDVVGGSTPNFEEIVKKSVRLRQAAKELKIPESGIVKNLKKRRDVLLTCVEKKAYDVKSILDAISWFYDLPGDWNIFPKIYPK